MSNAANTLHDTKTEVELTAEQLIGLGRIGHTANQVAELLKLSQSVLADLRDSIDVDAITDRIGPEMDALIQTLSEIMRLLNVQSLQDLQHRLHLGLKTIQRSHALEATPEVLMLVGSLHESGLLRVLPPILTQLRGITGELDSEQLGERLASANQSLSYWVDTAREGLRIAREQIGELNIPDQLAKLEELADQWWHIALRAKAIAQGNAETLGDRIEWLLGYAESLSGQISPVLGALSELAPDLIESIDFSSVATKITNGAIEWFEIGMNTRAFVKGDSPSLADRIRLMLEGAREAGLDQIIPDFIGMLGTVNRTGILRKLNLVLGTLEPHMPDDAELRRWLEQGAMLAQRYQPQIAGALPALDGALKAIEGTEQKGGGLFGLLGIVFSRKTQFVLRFVIEFAYRFLRGNKS